MTTTSIRRAFTLVEMLVVITLITMLVAITVPAISAARESARAATCKNNLRQLFLGMSTVAERTGKYCSGAFDWKRDGAVTEVGWVADLVNIGIVPGKLLCPSNQSQVSRTYEALLTSDGTGFSPLSQKAGSAAGAYPDGTPKVNPCRKILGEWPGGGGVMPPDETRRQFVEQAIFQPGYNTNFCASWWLVRSGVALDKNGNLHSTQGHTPLNNLERHCTVGPLNRARLDSSGVASSIVPILGDAAPSGEYLSASLGGSSGGQQLAKNITRGPVQTSTMEPPSANPDGTSYGTWWAVWNATVQDYRQFGTPHPKSCQIVFADGSVRPFSDTNGDGQINNGFPSGTGGFNSGEAEVTNYELFNRWQLKVE